MGCKISDRDGRRFHHLLPDTHGDHVGYSVHNINVDLIRRQQLYQGNASHFRKLKGVIVSDSNSLA